METPGQIEVVLLQSRVLSHSNKLKLLNIQGGGARDEQAVQNRPE